jgi:ABC-2 type transport system permease protein
VSNILAIAGKELRSYFLGPIAYVLIGLYAAVFGVFFSGALNFFVSRSAMAGGQFGGPQAMNVNQMVITPLLSTTSVVALFLLPMITMRTYAEEKRTGTIELLLTSPVTDLQIIMGKFLGAVALYSLMLLVSLVYIAMLFVFGTPEWRPVAAGYLGMILLGASFLSIGLFISSMTRNQIVAGVATFAVLLILWVINWLGDSSGPTAQRILSYISLTEHFDDFAKGIIDTKHIVYYLSFITLGLFLTAKSVDTERWRG